MSNLPAQPTPLIGRRKEIKAASELLLSGGARLVTLTGVGGTGKTRLAIQVASEVTDRFEDGAFFVPLAAVTDPALVLPAIAMVLGLAEVAGSTHADVLRDHLSDKQALLVLDNVEQVLAAAPALSDLLAAAPRLTMLMTSRAPLRVSAERQFPVPPLALPDPGRLPGLDALAQSEAIALFVTRAQAIRPDFELTSRNAAAIAEICVRLDGLPLAIELAAARINVLSPDAILDRMSNRLKLLTRGARDLPARQSALRDAIAWSYALLGGDEQKLFARLALFADGATLEAIEAVCNAGGDLQTDALDGLSALVDNSLLRPNERLPGDARFAMLETISEYAGEQLAALGEVESIRGHHTRYFLGVAEHAADGLQGANQPALLAKLDADIGNFRAALGSALEAKQTDLALRLCNALGHFWRKRGHFAEGRGWLQRALAQAGSVAPELRAGALQISGLLARYQNDYASASQYYAEAIAISSAVADNVNLAASHLGLGLVKKGQSDYDHADSHMRQAFSLYTGLGLRGKAADALTALATVAYERGDIDRAAGHYADVIRLYRQDGDLEGVAGTLLNLGAIENFREQNARARELYGESLKLFRELGEQWAVMLVQGNLGIVHRALGDVDSARASFEESLALARELGNQAGVAIALHGLGELSLFQHDYPKARDSLLESVRICDQIGAQRELADGLLCAAELFSAVTQAKHAAQFLGIASTVLDAAGAAWEPGRRRSYDQVQAWARKTLGEPAFEVAYSEGQALSPGQAIAILERANIPAAMTTAGASAGLTAREVDILRLVAQGLTDQQVADKLVLSKRTVSTHLVSIYGKLGVKSRTAAARFAVDNGLV